MHDEKSCEIHTGDDQETVWLYVMVGQWQKLQF